MLIFSNNFLFLLTNPYLNVTSEISQSCGKLTIALYQLFNRYIKIMWKQKINADLNQDNLDHLYYPNYIVYFNPQFLPCAVQLHTEVRLDWSVWCGRDRPKPSSSILSKKCEGLGRTHTLQWQHASKLKRIIWELRNFRDNSGPGVRLSELWSACMGSSLMWWHQIKKLDCCLMAELSFHYRLQDK